MTVNSFKKFLRFIKNKFNKVEEQIWLNKSTIGLPKKNLLKNTAISKVVNGINFIVQSDGTVIADGTATANAFFPINTITDFIGEELTLSGCPTGNDINNSDVYIALYGNDGIWFAVDRGEGITAVVPENAKDCRLFVRSGVTVNNIIFKPMLRYAGIKDSTYEPFTPNLQEWISEINKIPLSDYDDLDECMEPGIYYSANAAMSVTILNTPYTTGAFRLEVRQIGGQASRIQLLFTNSETKGIFCIRHRPRSSEPWGPWFTYQGISKDSGLFGGLDVGLGETLPNGTDLNNVRTPGVYCSKSSSTTDTMLSIPVDVKAGFRLEVVLVANNSTLCQRMIINTSKTTIYTRNYFNNTTWGPWILYSGTEVETKQ